MALASDQQERSSAFRTFADLSHALQASYRELESQVARLNRDLARERLDRARQRAERERLANRLEQLYDALPGGVLELDPDGIVRSANPAAEELLALPLAGRRWTAVESELGERGFSGEVQRANGRRLAIARRELADGGAIVLVTDTTEAALLREMVERHRRLATLGEMAARLAHDVRTPLSAALLYASRLELESVPDADRRELASRTVGRLRHLEGLVADMLGFARGGGGTSTRCDVGALLESVAQSLAPKLGAGPRLTIATRAPGLAVRGNPEALVNALVNLATNAIAAAGLEGNVAIEAVSEGDEAAIRVRDDGPGVPPEHRARIFEPFYTTRPSGTGLGLAVVRTVALAHGGSVELESSDRGACFVLRLPAAEGTS